MSSKNTLHVMCEKVQASDTLDELLSVLKAYLLSYSIKSYALSYYGKNPIKASQLLYSYVSKPLKIWHEYYLEEKYAEIDVTLADAYLMTLPVFWDVQQQQSIAKGAREQRLREDSLKFNIDKGLSLPIHGPNNDFLILTLHQRHGEKCLRDHENLQFEWLNFGLIFYSRLKIIISSEVDLDEVTILTSREQQCICLTEQGYSVTQIADELKITSRTVNFHLQNTNKKLGTNSKYLSIKVLREL